MKHLFSTAVRGWRNFFQPRPSTPREYELSPVLAQNISKAFPGFSDVTVSLGSTVKGHRIVLVEGIKHKKRWDYRCHAFDPVTGENFGGLLALEVTRGSRKVVVSFPGNARKKRLEFPLHVRRKGISRAIIAHALEFARSAHVHVLVLGAEDIGVRKLVEYLGARPLQDEEGLRLAEHLGPNRIGSEPGFEFLPQDFATRRIRKLMLRRVQKSVFRPLQGVDAK